MSESYTEADRGAMARLVIEIMEQWQLPPEVQLRLMGMEGSAKARHLGRYKNGQPLPDEPEVLERVRHLIGIHAAIEHNNPANPRVGFLWLKHTNKYFRTRSPIQVMVEDGLEGLHHVWVKLDCTQGWD